RTAGPEDARQDPLPAPGRQALPHRRVRRLPRPPRRESAKGKFTADPTRNLHRVAQDEYEDISRQALRAMADDCYLAEEMKNNTTWQGEHSQPVYDYAMGVTPLQLIK